MPPPNAVVSTVVRIVPPLERLAAEMLRVEPSITVELAGAQQVRLDREDPRSPGFLQVLEGLRKERLPVYLEVDPDRLTITRLLIPHVSRVIGIRPIDVGVLTVELEFSHGRHVLRSSSPDFEELERQLQEALRERAQVIVTETDEHEIIDVRAYSGGGEGPRPPFSRPETRPKTSSSARWTSALRFLRRCLACLCSWLWWWLRCPPPSTAQQVFDAMSATSCDPLTVPSPCIPFLYPDDGCWARAHEMCRLMISMGLSPRKVWIQGSLYVSTRNNPNCHVWWGWHVAPTLCVRGPRWFRTQPMVIDPSLFTKPVSEANWEGVQGDPNATLTESDASIYYLWGNVTDPNYTDTNQKLAFYRLQLQNRAIQYGPPPYANCP